MLKLVLASASPRRIELLKQIGLQFDIRPANINEDAKDYSDTGKYAMEMSRQKAMVVAEALHKEAAKETFVLGADTVVGIDEHLLGKPADQDDVRRMLLLLEDRWHEVTTGITLVKADTLETITEKEVTRVKFSTMPKGFIDRYIASGEPFDKAGSYGIQGFGGLLVERIEGDYFNIMGLPLFRLSRMLENQGFELLSWI
ncbi:MAG: Maf family protein [Clostridia bacterium]|nr:Maf family protein [Clostridia bacterium]